MNPLGFLNILDDLLSGVRGVIDSTYTSEEERRQANAKLQSLRIQALASLQRHRESIAEKQTKIILAEAKGESWIQRNWRPLLMMVFVAIVANNFVVAPYLQAFGLDGIYLSFPPELWALMTIGVGGYIGARTYEKVKGVTPHTPPPTLNDDTASEPVLRPEQGNVSVPSPADILTPEDQRRIGW